MSGEPNALGKTDRTANFVASAYHSEYQNRVLFQFFMYSGWLYCDTWAVSSLLRILVREHLTRNAVTFQNSKRILWWNSIVKTLNDSSIGQNGSREVAVPRIEFSSQCIQFLPG